MGKKESARGKLYVNFQNKEWGWTTRCYIITIRKRNKKYILRSNYRNKNHHKFHHICHFDFHPNSLQGLNLARYFVFVGSRSMININTIVIIMVIIIKIILNISPNLLRWRQGLNPARHLVFVGPTLAPAAPHLHWFGTNLYHPPNLPMGIGKGG